MGSGTMGTFSTIAPVRFAHLERSIAVQLKRAKKRQGQAARSG